MPEDQRKSERFDLPFIVKFRPAYGSTTYALGLTKNLSSRGIGLESRNFDFVLHEDLELELKLPKSDASAFLTGDVVWKYHVGSTSFAGIRFKIKNEDRHNEIMAKIASYANVPLESILYNRTGHPGKKRKSPGRARPGTPAKTTKKPGPASAELQAPDRPSLKRAKKKTPEKKTAKPPAKKVSKKSREPGFIKKYNKDRTSCRVSFLLHSEAAPDARNITIVGDFNNWDPAASPMKRLKNGDFKIILSLPSGREYRFKYLINGSRWENDWCADKYVPNSFGSDDSVVVV